jgi:hypothetical protein
MSWKFNPFTNQFDWTEPETDPVAMQYLNQSVKTDAAPTFDGATFTDEVTFKRDTKIYLDGL